MNCLVRIIDFCIVDIVLYRILRTDIEFIIVDIYVEIAKLLANAFKPRYMHYGRKLLKMAHVIQVRVTTQKIFLLKINKRRDRNGGCIT